MKLAPALLALLAATAPLATMADAIATCPPQPTHAYVLPGAVMVVSHTTGIMTKAGEVTVVDTNLADCDGDGLPLDRDGDYDLGVGGAFFGWGPWAATCGVNVHGPDVSVVDYVYMPHFQLGADDRDGSILGLDCLTDGIIAPGIDADDCLTAPYAPGFVGQTCGYGGDGGFWVILDLVVEEKDLGVTVTPPPLAGTITAGYFGGRLNPTMHGVVKVTRV